MQTAEGAVVAGASTERCHWCRMLRTRYDARRMTQTAVAGIDSPAAWWRLLATLVMSTLGGVGMWSVIVVLPAVQAEFGVDRATATLPYTLTMIGYGIRRHPDGPLERPLRRRPSAGRRHHRACDRIFPVCTGAVAHDVRAGARPAHRFSRQFRQLRPVARRHLALVRTTARPRGRDRRLRKLPGGHAMAAGRAAPDRDPWLARHSNRDRRHLPGHDAAAEPRAAPAPARSQQWPPRRRVHCAAAADVGYFTCSAAGAARDCGLVLLCSDVDAAGTHRRLLRRPRLRAGGGARCCR